MEQVTLRVRTNYGVKRVTVDINITIGELTREIVQVMNILADVPVILAFDMEGRRILDAGSVLHELGMRSGDEIFIMGKFEKIRIEKTTVNDKHEVIKAGEYMKLVENFNSESMVDKSSCDKGESEALPPLAPNPIHVNIPVQDILQDNYNRTEAVAGIYEEDIRAADDTRQMVLLDDQTQFKLNDEEEEEILRFERTLRETGMDEWTVQQEAVAYRDELFAERLLEREAREDSLQRRSYMTPLNVLEDRIANFRNSSSAPSSHPPLRLFQRNTFADNNNAGVSIQSTLPASTNSLENNKRRALSTKEIISPPLHTQRITHTTNTTSGNRVPRPSLYRSTVIDTDPSTSDMPNNLSDKADPNEVSMNAARLQQSNLAAANLNVSLQQTTYQPFGAFRTSTSAPSSAQGSSSRNLAISDSEIRKPAGGKATADPLLPPRKPSGKISSTINSRAISNGLSSNHDSLPSHRKGYKSNLPLRTLHHQPNSNQQQAVTVEATAYVPSFTSNINNNSTRRSSGTAPENIATDDTKTVAFRNHLHHNIPLPTPVAREVQSSVEDDALNLAIMQSLEQNRPVRPPARDVIVEYDEEDELLARALQDSLNDMF